MSPKDRQPELFETDSDQDQQPSQPLTVVPRFRLQLVAEGESSYAGEPDQLGHPKAAAEFLHREIGDRPQEHMAAVYLDTRNRVIGWSIAFVGTINRCAVEPRAILATGLLLNAAGFLLAHNHPSGDPSPSAEDLAFTRRMAEAGEVVGVRLVDHLVLGDEGKWVSLRQRGVF